MAPKRKTFEQVCTEYYERYPNSTLKLIKIADENNHKMIEYECTLCRKNHITNRNNLISGSGCPDCAFLGVGTKLSYNEDKAKELLFKKFSNDITLVTYCGRAMGKSTFKCNRDDTHNAFEANLHDLLLTKYGCPKCRISLRSKRTTSNENDVIKYLDEHNTGIKLISYGGSASAKSKFQCIEDPSHPLWQSTFCEVKYGRLCPECGRERSAKHHNIPIEEAVRIVNGKSHGAFRLEEYSGSASSNSTFLCLVKPGEHGVWKARLSGVMRSTLGCPKCSLENRVVTEMRPTESYQGLLDAKYGAGLYTPVEKYRGLLYNTKHLCSIHNFEFIEKPTYVLRHNTFPCPLCRDIEFASMGELKVATVMREHNVEFDSQFYFDNCRSVGALRFDFYVPAIDLLIEINGLQHYEYVSMFGGVDEHYRRVQSDLIKQEYCFNNKKELLYVIDRRLKDCLEMYHNTILIDDFEEYLKEKLKTNS